MAARLTEAMVKGHGFGGLRDGLRLLRRLVQECWDRMYPIIQDGDMDARAGPFEWLDDELRGARFPHTLRTAPLTSVPEEQNYGWQQWRDAQEAKGKVTPDVIDRAVMATPREFCQAVVDDIGESVVELTELTNALSGHMGEGAPGLGLIRRALTDCQELARQILHKKGPPPAAGEANSGPAAPAETGAAAVIAPVIQRPLTRDDVLSRLADASALLLQMEPQSPIAYMIQRAVKLAKLPLPDLMRVLVRDANVLGQLDRDLDLGLEKQDAAKAGKK